MVLTSHFSCLVVSPSAWVGIALVLCIGVLGPLFIQSRQKRKDTLPLPPTPPGSWLTGNLTELMVAVGARQQHFLIAKWAREHGEIVRVRMGLFVEYYINSDKAVRELFDRQSAFTSERPRWFESSEQICNKLNILLLRASDPRWKHHRKITHNGLTSVARADAAGFRIFTTSPQSFSTTSPILHLTNPKAGICTKCFFDTPTALFRARYSAWIYPKTTIQSFMGFTRPVLRRYSPLYLVCPS